MREAYRHGLEIEEHVHANPFAFGVIGSTDSHNASSPVEESNYTGKIGHGDGDPVARRDGGSITTENIRYSASGLAGIWAEENTRESLFAAMRRREVFATSGPRIELNLRADTAAASVPMGGRIDGAAESPTFLVRRQT